MKITKAMITAALAAQAQAFANVAHVEARPWAPSPLNGTIVPGEIYLANEATFIEGNFNEPLTSYVVGYKDPNNIEATLEFFAPATPVPRRFTYNAWTNVEEFLSDGANEDLRAIGSDFKRAEYTGTKVEAKTDNRGLMVRVDLDQVADATAISPSGGFPAYQQAIVAKLTRRLRRNSLRRAIALLSAAATNTAKTWDTSAGKNPDQDLKTILIAGATASGIRSNRIGYGDTAFDKRSVSYEAQNNAGGYAASGMDIARLATRLMVDQVLVSKERYSAAGATKAEILANLVLMFFAQSGADIEDPSNIKRFVSPTDSGGPLRVFVQQISPKLVDISVEHYEGIKITSTLGINKVTVS